MHASGHSCKLDENQRVEFEDIKFRIGPRRACRDLQATEELVFSRIEEMNDKWDEDFAATQYQPIPQLSSFIDPDDVEIVSYNPLIRSNARRYNIPDWPYDYNDQPRSACFLIQFPALEFTSAP
jgi:hypothetical protein